MEDMKREAALEAIRRFAEAFGIDPMRARIEKIDFKTFSYCVVRGQKEGGFLVSPPICV